MNTANFQKMIPTKLLNSIPTPVKATVMLRAIGLWKIPLLFSVKPTVVELNDEKAVIRIRLSRWTKNHLGSMYFGTLAIGADAAVGLAAVHHIYKHKAKKLQLVFKDFKADFLKRPDDNVLFICDEGHHVEELVKKAKADGERHHLTIHGRAVLEKAPEEPVATFALTLSLKNKTKG
jgi:acyl-coenzyme A thioesterase PaaI-like protein